MIIMLLKKTQAMHKSHHIFLDSKLWKSKEEMERTQKLNHLKELSLPTISKSSIPHIKVLGNDYIKGEMVTKQIHKTNFSK